MERFLFTKLFMLIAITLVLQMHGYKDCLEKERTALLEIKVFFINSSPVMADDHNTSDCCSSYHVECNTTTGRVIDLSPSRVRVIDLSLSHMLYRSSPILNFSLFQLFEGLQSLNLSFNFFETHVDSIYKLCFFFIGSGLANLRNLKVLYLSYNSTNGTLQEIANLRNLEFLELYANVISGTLQDGVPVQLSNITGLQFLDISKNRLSGSIASSTNLSSMQIIHMQKNGLSGSIPNAFFKSSALVTLDLRDIEFSGSILNEFE
ncbi:hypothetical protein ACOSP7_004581 [Xanthoceras sorbifolium]